MKIVEIKGDLFANLNEHDVIAHGVNCQGAMGSGIAVPIRKKFFNNYRNYRLHCLGGLLAPGDILPFVDVDSDTGKSHMIVNMATQYYPGPDATYERVEQSFDALNRLCSLLGITTVKIPRIASGLGGLKWYNVSTILERTGPSDVTLEVYRLED